MHAPPQSGLGDWDEGQHLRLAQEAGVRQGSAGCCGRGIRRFGSGDRSAGHDRSLIGMQPANVMTCSATMALGQQTRQLSGNARLLNHRGRSNHAVDEDAFRCGPLRRAPLGVIRLPPRMVCSRPALRCRQELEAAGRHSCVVLPNDGSGDWGRPDDGSGPMVDKAGIDCDATLQGWEPGTPVRPMTKRRPVPGVHPITHAETPAKATSVQTQIATRLDRGQRLAEDCSRTRRPFREHSRKNACSARSDSHSRPAVRRDTLFGAPAAIG